MKRTYRCRACDDERDTPLGGCVVTNPLGMQPTYCPFMNGVATWREASAAGQKVKFSTMESKAIDTMKHVCNVTDKYLTNDQIAMNIIDIVRKYRTSKRRNGQ